MSRFDEVAEAAKLELIAGLPQNLKDEVDRLLSHGISPDGVMKAIGAMLGNKGTGLTALAVESYIESRLEGKP